MGNIKKSITELVGHTPLLELSNYERLHGLEATLLAKLEYFNPSGSVKDRAALNMIEAAEREGLIKPGDTIVENTSGNTGIGLAAFAAAKGYKLEVFLENGASKEREQILKAYGATLRNFFRKYFFLAVHERNKKCSGYLFASQHCCTSNANYGFVVCH